MKQSNDFQVRQSNYFQTEQEVSGSNVRPNISPADCQNTRDELRLVACQKTSDELRLAAGTTETPPGQQVAGQTCSIVDQGADQLQVKCGSDTFYMTRGSSTLYLARRLGLVDIIDQKADRGEKDTSDTSDKVVETMVDIKAEKVGEREDKDNLAYSADLVDYREDERNWLRNERNNGHGQRRMRRIRTDNYTPSKQQSKVEEGDDDRELRLLQQLRKEVFEDKRREF